MSHKYHDCNTCYIIIRSAVDFLQKLKSLTQTNYKWKLVTTYLEFAEQIYL